MISIYLDDLRQPKYNFMHIARNYEDCIDLLENNKVQILSLDHDLGGESKTGYDVCKYIVQYDLWPEEIYMHSMNPVGRDNMYKLLDRYRPESVKLYRYGL